MDSVMVPEEAASHLGAIVLAFNRDISGHLLDEADELAKLGQATAAVLIAGTVLEYLERSPVASLIPPEDRSHIESWRLLRNQAAHGSAVTLSVEQTLQVIDGIRRIVMIHKIPGRPDQQSRAHVSVAAPGIKGKYAHVRTSSDAFISRKREELELEDRG